ncbi:hypothetical protein GOB57_07695 [Sinorhizobium meliloti]|nr:hypothetical protein [Sinorhizobium meliloti]
MTPAKKKEDLDLPGVTAFGLASIKAELRAVRERREMELADDMKYCGDTIDYMVVPSRYATEIAWARTRETLEDMRAKSDTVFACGCFVAVLSCVATTGYVSSVILASLNPVILVAVNVVALCFYAAFFTMAYDYIARGGFLSSFVGVLVHPVTGYFPWMRDRVLLASGGAWGVGRTGLYVPRPGRDDYEPYHDLIPYGMIESVEVSSGAGEDARDYPAHLIVRASATRQKLFEFPDASGEDGSSALEIADRIRRRVASFAEAAVPRG